MEYLSCYDQPVVRWQVREPAFPLNLQLETKSAQSVWQVMIEQLVTQTGSTYGRLADDLGISRSTLNRMRYQPDYVPKPTVLNRLLAMYLHWLDENNDGHV